MSIGISAQQKAALERLIRIAQGDTGQSRMTAEFLLSWGMRPIAAASISLRSGGVDTKIAADMVTVFGLVAVCHRYPDDLGYGEEFRRIVHAWRPALKYG